MRIKLAVMFLLLSSAAFAGNWKVGFDDIFSGKAKQGSISSILNDEIKVSTAMGYTVFQTREIENFSSMGLNVQYVYSPKLTLLLQYSNIAWSAGIVEAQRLVGTDYRHVFFHHSLNISAPMLGCYYNFANSDELTFTANLLLGPGSGTLTRNVESDDTISAAYNYTVKYTGTGLVTRLEIGTAAEIFNKIDFMFNLGMINVSSLKLSADSDAAVENVKKGDSIDMNCSGIYLGFTVIKRFN